MAADFQVHTPLETARKWHALAERRRRHFVDLYRSDRWRRYYTEEAFLVLMREVIDNVEIWAKVIERSPAEHDPATTQH